MEKDFTFIDFDGVILDSEQRMLDIKDSMGLHDHKCESEFDQFFEYTNSHPEIWEDIICNAKEINDSVGIIQELERQKRKIAILTKIHTLYEMKVKVEELRNNRKIQSPVIFVPPGVKKHQVVIPNLQMLIDDSKKNVRYWIANGGQGRIFDPSIEQDTDERVKSLAFLLKR